MDSIRYSIIDFMKTCNVTRPLYRILKSKLGVNQFCIDSIPEVLPQQTPDLTVRYNLVLPTLRNTKVFGGILTAIKIFRFLLDKGSLHGRIIVISGESYDKKWTYKLESNKETDSVISLFFVSDSKEIDIGTNDIFIATSWKTAYAFMPVLLWQRKQYKLKKRKLLYLIQDYEPGFHAWSTEYVLSESTYKYNSDLIMALFNSEELYDFFDQRSYSFAYKMFFKPTLNEKLKEHLINISKASIKKEKKILIYGRPSEPRNAFEIIRKALAIWSENYEKSSDWKIISLGEDYDDIKLENNLIEARGKVSLEEYANIMTFSYAGVSLMVSPHPSYPPLEMSTFGVRTITNKFENKDLSYFSENIVSISECTPIKIAEKLIEVCETYGKKEIKIKCNGSYFEGNEFEKIIDSVGERLYDMVFENKDKILY